MLGAIANVRSGTSTRIDSANVNQLHPIWQFSTPATVSHAPLLHDGRLYTADWNGRVYALEAASGTVLWQETIEQTQDKWPWHGFAGTGTIGEGLVFEASAEGNAFALDLKSGQVAWKMRFAGHQYAGNLSALLYHDGLVYFGTSSVEEVIAPQLGIREPGFRGAVLALEAQTGRLAWSTNLTQPPHNGVAIWTSFALDPDSSVLFCGTGNNYTGRASELSDSVIAMDASTGDLRWHTQAYSHDVFTSHQRVGGDIDFSGGPQLFEASIDGETRQLVGASSKSGFYWVFDRGDGKTMWSTWINYAGPAGGMMAEASIADGRIYCWGNDHFDGHQPENHLMNVVALDGASGDRLWWDLQAQPPASRTAGFVANDVYLVPSVDGRIRAYRTGDGKQLWTSAPTLGPIASSLSVGESAIYCGASLPKSVGGMSGANGITCFSL